MLIKINWFFDHMYVKYALNVSETYNRYYISQTTKHTGFILTDVPTAILYTFNKD